MKRTGEILKAAREEKKLSLHEVALFLKINSRVLQAIEEGDQSQLPARTFLRGFVQSYAKFLKLDPQLVLQVFNEETSPPATGPMTDTAGNPTAEINTTPTLNSSPEKDDSADVDPVDLEKSILTQSQTSQDKLGFKTIAISVLGLFLVVILYFTNSVIKKYQKEAAVDPLAAVVPVETPETADSTESTSSQITTLVPDKQVLAPDTAPKTIPTPVPTLQNSTALVDVKTPIIATAPAPTIESKPKITEKVDVKPIEKPITTPPAAPPVQTNTEKKEEGKLIEVIVEATDSVEIEYSSAKTSPQKMILKADQIHTFKSRSGVRLKISNGGAVNIIMNGRDLGAPGASGQPTQVAY